MLIVCHCEECPRYRDRERPMKMVQERELSWAFQCQTCLNLRLITKERIGGMKGAGEREDGRLNVVGRGF